MLGSSDWHAREREDEESEEEAVIPHAVVALFDFQPPADAPSDWLPLVAGLRLRVIDAAEGMPGWLLAETPCGRQGVFMHAYGAPDLKGLHQSSSSTPAPVSCPYSSPSSSSSPCSSSQSQSQSPHPMSSTTLMASPGSSSSKLAPSISPLIRMQALKESRSNPLANSYGLMPHDAKESQEGFGDFHEAQDGSLMGVSAGVSTPFSRLAPTPRGLMENSAEFVKPVMGRGPSVGVAMSASNALSQEVFHNDADDVFDEKGKGMGGVKVDEGMEEFRVTPPKESRQAFASDFRELIQRLKENDRRLTAVSLAGCRLDSRDLMHLLDALRQANFLRRLDMSRRAFSEADVSMVVRAVMTNPYLREVDLTHNNLGLKSARLIRDMCQLHRGLLVCQLYEPTSRRPGRPEIAQCVASIQWYLASNRALHATLRRESCEMNMCGRRVTASSLDFFFDQVHVKYLNLSHNFIDVMSPKLIVMVNLKVANLSHNELLEFPATFGHLQNLRHLDVSYNSIKVLPDYLATMKKLRSINCDGNNLSAIPAPILISKIKSISVFKTKVKLPKDINRPDNGEAHLKFLRSGK